jgi:hypothetical protein
MKKVFVALDKEEDHKELVQYLRGRSDIETDVYPWNDLRYFYMHICQAMNQLYDARKNKKFRAINDEEDLGKIVSAEELIIKNILGESLPDMFVFDPDVFIIKPEFRVRTGNDATRIIDDSGRWVPIPLFPIEDHLAQRNDVGIYIANGFVGLEIPTFILYSQDTVHVYEAFKQYHNVFGVQKPYEKDTLIRHVDSCLASIIQK